ncbi:MAG: hypothetical protein ACLU3U_10555, partial [Gallintestinimicrobium sp.]
RYVIATVNPILLLLPAALLKQFLLERYKFTRSISLQYLWGKRYKYALNRAAALTCRYRKTFIMANPDQGLVKVSNRSSCG